jgi:hypothetical protein
MGSRVLGVLPWLLAAGTAAACGNGGGARDADGPADVDAGEEADGPFDEPEAGDAPLDEPGAGEGEVDSEAEADAATGPGPEFDRFCRGRAWDGDLVPGKVGELSGEATGYYDGFPAGTLETMKVIPEHPFRVRTIRVAFGAGRGDPRLRLMKTMGHSYPADYPHLDEGDGNLIAPVEFHVSAGDPEEWHEIDVSGQDVFLLPRESYVIVYEHTSRGPYLALEELAADDPSRALIITPDSEDPYGVDGNYRMELAGDFFCAWEDGERWFEESGGQPFAETNSAYVQFADLDGDGHDDLVANTGRPAVFLGDGAGGFAVPGFEPFPDIDTASWLVFADVDGDGDRDAFAATWVQPDGDGDGVTLEEGDCDGSNADVNPDHVEVPGNGLDDDCDGTVDDGTSTADADGDGATVVDGDCDDTRDDVRPGAPELLDARDNDCDGSVDEDFPNTIHLNDGSGRFAVLPDSGVEAYDPTGAAAFGDGNADGSVDLYWGNWLVHYPDVGAVPDRYVTGNGDGTFTEATRESGMVSPDYPRACYGVAWTDYDNDGAQDVWVGNYGYGLNFMWRNRGTGRFEEVGLEIGVARDRLGAEGGNTYGGDFGDFDNDGDMDLVEPNIAHPRFQPWSDPTLFLVNEGPPDHHFVERRDELGLHWDEGDVNVKFADFDNDMDVDLAVASLYPQHFARLYRNDGAAGLTDVSYEAGIVVMEAVSVIWSDVDEDGDVDLVVGDRYLAPWVHLFLNRVGQDNNWLELVLEGTTTNRDAIGARVTLEAGGVVQIRDVAGGGGHANAQDSRVVHFGLGSESAIDSLAVRWVGGGEEAIAGAAPNGRWRVVEGSGRAEAIP